MKALVLTAYNHLEIQDWPRPEIAADEVLLRVAACGICGSDIHGMDGSTGRRQPPIIMGHEAAGTIVAVGAEVRDWAAGDRVTFDSTIYCGRCWYCRRGEINLCDNRRVLGVSCDDYRRHGAFAELVRLGGALAGMALGASYSDMAAKPSIGNRSLRLRPYAESDIPELLPLIGAREVAATTLRIAHPYPSRTPKDFLLSPLILTSSGWQ